MMLSPLHFSLPARGKAWLRLLAILGGLLMLLGLWLRPERAWPNFLLAFLLVNGLALGALLFLAIYYSSSSAWSTVFRRVPEAMAATLPITSAGILLILWQVRRLYPWAAKGAVLHNAAWLDLRWFWLRSIFYLALWSWFAITMVRRSRRQDIDGDWGHLRANIVAGCIFLVAFSLTIPLAGTDWLMSLAPDWHSSIWGVYIFGGIYESSLAALILLMLWFKDRPPFKGLVNRYHLQDLGKLLFAFAAFWGYIWFSQFMLIWYGNLPDEIPYFVARSGHWMGVSAWNVVLNWAVPFFVLLSQRAKRSPRVMGWVAALVLLGHWLDLYWMILPTYGASPPLGWWEVIFPLAGVAVFLYLFFRSFAGAVPIPLRDPHLQRSLEHGEE